MKKILLSVFSLLALCLFIGSGFYPQKDQPAVRDSLFAMNTYMTFTAYGEEAQNALDESKQLIRNLEARWSVTDENSEIYRANHSKGQTVQLSVETAKLLAFALQMAQETEGALDPTIYPVLTAWGFTTGSKQVPEPAQIAELLQSVDYKKIQLSGASLTVPAGMKLDLGAVGKGYAADLVTEQLKADGIESAMISLGGNIQAIGSRPDGSDWKIGIRNPAGNGNLGVLEISDAAVVTSGKYENYFEDENDNVYWHILDPSTGYPADQGLQAITIISPEGKLSDALSTALFVMGPERAATYWRENGGFEMLMITGQSEIILTEGLAGRFSLNEGRAETIRVIEK